ncbi:MAG: hypothetical protein WBQ94_30105 [Terracidiphilus sp.]
MKSPGLCLAAELLLLGLVAVTLPGCNSAITKAGNGSQTPNTAQNYLGGGVGNLQTYQIDHVGNTFVVTSYNFATGGTAIGGSIQDSGSVSQLGSGIYDLDITYLLGGYTLGPPPLTGNWLVEMPGQAALNELEATSSGITFTSFAPLAPTSSCPSYSSSQSFQFVTIPNKLSTKTTISAGGWNPKIETAFGSFSVTTNANSVNFANIGQFTLPSANGGAPGAPVNPAPSSAAAACSSTFFGDTISYPTSSTVTDPGGPTQSIPPSATIAIGPTGFLVEDAGSPSGTDTSLPPYENLLGAGYGAIGLPKPAAALTTTSLVSAQYQGILYGAASGSSAPISSPGFRLIGSFGYPKSQTPSCAGLPAQTSSNTILYGGEFNNNDPSANAFGNCDLAIDLGSQDASNNGLYTGVNVYVSTSFPHNDGSSASPFRAVAVAGQINGKYAIFLIGVDAIQPWGIYLLQSN